MADLSLTLSPQTPRDLAAIEKLDERAFGPGRFARSAYRLREPDYALSFVARARVPIDLEMLPHQLDYDPVNREAEKPP